MGFQDILKKSFLEGFTSGEISTTSTILVFAVTACIGIYIFGVYRVISRRAFYSKSFNISLVALTLITAAIILAIQNSVVISLGMVGALSIVRFRSAEARRTLLPVHACLQASPDGYKSPDA
jgi:hypothetical protein